MTDTIEMPPFLKREKVTGTTAVEIISPTAPAPTGWRARLKVHPAAEMFPLLEPDELRALADDIKANGLLNKATVWWDGRTPVLLDGRNRLDALELAGMLERSPCGDIAEHLYEPVSNLYPNCEHLDPWSYVISANIHRRHLTREQKRDLIANLLKAQPEKSDRQIAATAKVSHVTVGAVRAEQQRRGQIDHVESRTDTKGRKQPTKASKPKSPPPPDASDPENAPVLAFQARAGEALRYCFYEGPPSRRAAKAARQTAEAWLKLADEIEGIQENGSTAIVH